jgi:Protein of unknown function (DUF1552)
MRPDSRISRRSLLRGAGAALALPLLDAMIPPFARAATAKAAMPTRMAFFYVPNGIVMEEWTPQTGVGPGEWALPETLPRITSVLTPYRNELMLLSGLECNGGRALGDGPGDHGRAGAAYLTATHPKKSAGKDLHAGISVDQVAAQKLAGITRFPSLELGCEEGVQGGNCDNGYSCTYSNTLSWRTPTSPLPPEVRPRAVFERLFGSLDLGSDPAHRRRQEMYEKSILDGVLDDARRLQASLGGSDKTKMEEYLSSVREIEIRIQSVERSANSKPVEYPVPSASVPSDFGEHARLMTDLLVLAFQTDLTRVSTVLLSIEQSPRAYGAEIGISEGHHGLTHHSGDKEKIEKVTQINCYHIKSLVYALDRMKAVKEGDGTLLDHSMIVYGSGISDGNRHDHGNLPVVLAGRGNGTWKPGRHIRYAPETPMANLFVSMLDRMGVEPEHFGDSKGKLDRLAV